MWENGERLQMWHIKGTWLNSYKMKGQGGSYLRVGEGLGRGEWRVSVL